MKIICMFIFFAGFISCTSQQPQVASNPNALKRINITSSEQVAELRQAGAEIIVQEPDYVVARTEKMTQQLSFAFKPVQEKDLIQRLAKVAISGPADLQRIADMGIDIWEIKADSAICRVFDVHLEKCQQQNLTYQIIASNAAERENAE